MFRLCRKEHTNQTRNEPAKSMVFCIEWKLKMAERFLKEDVIRGERFYQNSNLSNLMLANSDRLKKNKEFDLVFKEGRTVYGEFLGIKARKNNLNNNRFGVLLSTKVSKSAVERNLYKRRIKAIISQENLKIKTGQDCVIIVLPVIIGKKAQEIKTEIQNIFIKLKFYN